MSSRSLIVVAHGSRRKQSNDEVRRLTEAVARQALGRFVSVSSAFLELADPDIPSAIDAAITDGANEVVLLPYFLSAGRHVAHDIPHLVADKQRQYPHVKLTLGPHLGHADGMAALVLSMISRD